MAQDRVEFGLCATEMEAATVISQLKPPRRSEQRKLSTDAPGARGSMSQADKSDVMALEKKIAERRNNSPYVMDSASFYNFALDALVLIAGTLVDIKRVLEIQKGSKRQ